MARVPNHKPKSDSQLDSNFVSGCSPHVANTRIESAVLPTRRYASTVLAMALSVCLSVSQSHWRRGVVVSGVRRMNEVNARRAGLVMGWVTVFGRVYHLSM